MSSPQKVISLGLGRFASQDPNGVARFGPDAGAKATELLQQSIDKAKAAGFELTVCDVNPQDYDDTMRRFNETLSDGDGWVGVNIGYGVRGHKEHTALLERIINTAWEIRPGIKIMFSNGPDDIADSIKRSFPESF